MNIDGGTQCCAKMRRMYMSLLRHGQQCVLHAQHTYSALCAMNVCPAVIAAVYQGKLCRWPLPFNAPRRHRPDTSTDAPSSLPEIGLHLLVESLDYQVYVVRYYCYSSTRLTILGAFIPQREQNLHCQPYSHCITRIHRAIDSSLLSHTTD